MLALVPIPVESILPGVPETGLFSLLVTGSRDFGVFDFLDVEGCHFNDDLNDRQGLFDFLNQFDVGIQLVLNRWRQPAFRFLPVQKSRLTVPGLPVSP